MGMFDFLFGKKEQMQQAPTMTVGQNDLLMQLLSGLSGGGEGAGGGAMGQGMSYLQNLLSGDTSQFEQPLMRQFNEQVVPGMAERFSGMGSGAQGSSAFGQQMGQAGAGLMEQLGSLRGGLQQQGLGQLSGLMGQGLGARSFENIFRPETSGFLGGMAPGMGQMGGLGLLKLLGLM